jgi:Zn-dependent alcohol dehydrogenase
MSTTFVPVEPGCDVVVFGCGPIGLSIINGAVLHSAGQIIAVDPIAYRREVALQIGATTAIDPTGKNDTLGAELRDMCKGRTDRYFAGGRTWQVTVSAAPPRAAAAVARNTSSRRRGDSGSIRRCAASSLSPTRPASCRCNSCGR